MLFIVNGLFIQKKAEVFPSWGSDGTSRFGATYSKNTILQDDITNQQEVAK